MRLTLLKQKNRKNSVKFCTKIVRLKKSSSTPNENKDSILDDYLGISQSTLESVWLTPEEDEAWKNL